MKRETERKTERKIKRRKRRVLLPLALSAALLLSACGQSGQGNADTAASETEAAQETESGAEEQTTESAGGSGTADGASLAEEFFSERDYRTEYDEASAVKISFEGSSASSSDAKAAVVSGSTVTITDEGCYILSGTITDGQLIIDAEESDKIQLVLNGVTIHSESSAAIYVKQADKVFLTTAEGTENTLSNGGSYTAIDENAIDAVIFSKDDLTLNGEGKLTIRAEAGHGIVSRDDGMNATNGTSKTENENTGMQGEGARPPEPPTGSADFAGRPSENAENGQDRRPPQNGEAPPERGGAEAGAAGDPAGKTAAAEEQTSVPERGGMPGMGGAAQQPFSEAEEGVYISISGGTIRISASGDGVDSNGDLYISGGEIYISGPENDGNGSLDYNEEGIISGGVLAAAGSSGMAQRFSESSPQKSLQIETGESPAGTELVLYDSTGRELLRWTAEKAYSCVTVSLPSLAEGESYTLKSGDSEETIVLDGSASTR